MIWCVWKSRCLETNHNPTTQYIMHMMRTLLGWTIIGTICCPQHVYPLSTHCLLVVWTLSKLIVWTVPRPGLGIICAMPAWCPPSAYTVCTHSQTVANMLHTRVYNNIWRNDEQATYTIMKGVMMWQLQLMVLQIQVESTVYVFRVTTIQNTLNQIINFKPHIMHAPYQMRWPPCRDCSNALNAIIDCASVNSACRWTSRSLETFRLKWACHLRLCVSSSSAEYGVTSPGSRLGEGEALSLGSPW